MENFRQYRNIKFMKILMKVGCLLKLLGTRIVTF